MIRIFATNLGYQDVNTTFFYCHSRYINRFPYNSVFSDILLLQKCQIYFVVSHIISTYYLTVLLNATTIYRVLYDDSFSIFNFYWGEVQNIKDANYWTSLLFLIFIGLGLWFKTLYQNIEPIFFYSCWRGG